MREILFIIILIILSGCDVNITAPVTAQVPSSNPPAATSTGATTTTTKTNQLNNSWLQDPDMNGTNCAAPGTIDQSVIDADMQPGSSAGGVITLCNENLLILNCCAYPLNSDNTIEAAIVGGPTCMPMDRQEFIDGMCPNG